MSEEKHYEMLWDCPRCGTEGLLGKTHRHCPACGAPQDPDKRYFPDEENKVAVEDHVFVGADKECPACSTPNAASAGFCVNCGSPMDGSKGVSIQDDGSESPAPPPAPPSGKGKMIAIIAGLLIVLVAIAGIVFATWKEDGGAMAKAHSWERTIDIESFQKVKEGEWCDRKPRDAYNVRTEQKKRDTEKVQVGETCKTVRKDKGDGTFSEKEQCKPKYEEKPVYDDWCTFYVDRWKKARAEQAKGDSVDPDPAWPEVTVKECRQLGCERQGKKRESYTVHFERQGKDSSVSTCDFDEIRWSSIAVGDYFTAQFRRMDGGLDCDSLKPL